MTQDVWSLGGGGGFGGGGMFDSIFRRGPTMAGLGFTSSLDYQEPWSGFRAGKPGPDPKMMQQIAWNKAGAGGGSWYDSLMSNDFLMSTGASMLQGGMQGGWQGAAGAALPAIGMAVGGPVGGAIGALLGGLFGQKKQRGDTPQNPVHVKVINPGDLATALSNAVKSLVAQLGAAGMNDLVKQVRAQSMLKGYS